jgi:hypothetical protein
MAAVELAFKHCPDCDTTKPVAEFHRHPKTRDRLQVRCKPCFNAYERERRATRRAAMGEEAWLEYQRQIIRRHRQKTGNVQGKAYARDKFRAVQVLIDLHRDEFEHLLLLARRGELPAQVPH